MALVSSKLSVFEIQNQQDTDLYDQSHISNREGPVIVLCAFMTQSYLCLDLRECLSEVFGRVNEVRKESYQA